jgi:dipeptidyl aminopeptidase/acylaminoacyl peptidase
MQLSEHDIQQYLQSHTALGATWHNLARARFASEQSLLQYSPLSSVGRVTAPLLIIAGVRLRVHVRACMACGGKPL